MITVVSSSNFISCAGFVFSLSSCEFRFLAGVPGPMHHCRLRVQDDPHPSTQPRRFPKTPTVSAVLPPPPPFLPEHRCCNGTRQSPQSRVSFRPPPTHSPLVPPFS